MANRICFPSYLDIIAVFCLAVLPDLFQSQVVVSRSVGELNYTFSYLHGSLIVRSLQVSVPILLIMHLKNVDWSEYGFKPVRKVYDAASALGLVVISYAAYGLAYNVLTQFVADVQSGNEIVNAMIHKMSPTSTIAILVMVASSLANGFAEELALRSFLIPRVLQVSGSKAVAVLVTSGLFAAYHTYQGSLGAVSAFVVGIVFGTYFVTTRRFWPVATAHAAMDLIPQIGYL